MAEVFYTSVVRIERLRGGLRRAYLPGEAAPVVFGTHGPIREHYGAPAGTEERASTLDYLVATAGG